MKYPSYYSILTADVRYDPRLKKYADCKVLYSEITALSNKFGYCKASNKYFSQLYDRPVQTISRWINLLKDFGYLKIEMIYKENSKEIQERRIYPISTPINAGVNTYSHEKEGGINTDVNPPINTGVKDNSTSFNNTSINSCSSGSNYAAKESTAWIELEKLGIHPGRQIYIKEDFLHYVHKLTDEVVKYAVLNMAKEIDKPNWNYLDSVLYRYEQEGINTLEKAKQDDERHRQKSKKQYSRYSRKSKPRIDFTDPHRFDDM